MVDLGGVRRQIYSTFFEGIAKGYLELYEGPCNRVRPCVKPCNIVSGLMVLFGKAVGHSLLMDHIGFPYLSPAIYYYAIGKEDEALPFIMIDDISGHFHYSVSVVIILMHHAVLLLNFYL